MSEGQGDSGGHPGDGETTIPGEFAKSRAETENDTAIVDPFSKRPDRAPPVTEPVPIEDETGGRKFRAEPRVSAAFRVCYQSVEDVVFAYTGDVSRGGLFVQTQDFLPVGAVVRLQLAMPDQDRELWAIARVSHVLDKPGAQEHGRKPGMGMEFLDVGGAPLADRIAKYIAQTSPEVQVPPPPAGMSSWILVVDSNASDRERIAEAITEVGHNVVTADNGVRALGTAMKVEPDLVITDVPMPFMDGWQLVRMLRARPSLARIPVVFVTGLDSDEQRLNGYRLGVDDYLAKPIDPDVLAFRVQRVLERWRAYPRDVVKAKTLRGDLGHVSLSNLLSYLGTESRTGLLLIVRQDETAMLYVREGIVQQVELSEQDAPSDGEARLYYVLDWCVGRFEFADADIPDDDQLGLDTTMALLEHARQRAAIE